MDLMINFTDITNAYSYVDYRNLVTAYAQGRSTSGVDQPFERIEATKLNAHRMRRIDKQIELNDSLKKTIKSINKKLPSWGERVIIGFYPLSTKRYH